VVNETAFSGANGTPVALDEQVINDVAPLNDSTDTTSNNGTWSALAPGDTIRYRATYTVVQADIDNQ
jgi:large repetitive protein